ncbi:hypothetical protein [Hyalangium sp.]|uniref:hypothetical protein n=1 Tax=Hyalangium sp. TaxID=2028555 RepID=UPI002D2660FA|nr:hypothetical protein [Hyalangium sp.]HYH97951.1 hypothetical protein [Hyalangium sp.]
MSSLRLLSTVFLALLWSSVALAQAPSEPPTTGDRKSVSTPRVQELEASIAELKASREEAPENMKGLVDRQLESLQQAIKMQQMVDTANEQNKARRAQVPADQKAFWTPVAPAKVPSWISDTQTRAELKDGMLKCPEGTKVYAEKHAVDCRLPPTSRGGIPKPHGLALWFYKSTGKLKAQRYYENGLLRWDISYHTIGGRSSEGLYDNEKPKVDRENGLHTSYAPNGTITRQAEYKSGQLQGWSKQWEDDGYPSTATRYENNKQVEMIGPTGQKM